MLYSKIGIGECMLVTKPENVAIKEGESARFNCSTDDTTVAEIWWLHSEQDNTKAKHVFDGSISNGYRSVVNIDIRNNSKGVKHFDLIINKTTSNLAGLYFCGDMANTGDNAAASLTILESTCAQKQSKWGGYYTNEDVMQINCTSSYKGQLVPGFKLDSACNGNVSTQTSKDNRVTYSFTVYRKSNSGNVSCTVSLYINNADTTRAINPVLPKLNDTWTSNFTIAYPVSNLKVNTNIVGLNGSVEVTAEGFPFPTITCRSLNESSPQFVGHILSFNGEEGIHTYNCTANNTIGDQVHQVKKEFKIHVTSDFDSSGSRGSRDISFYYWIGVCTLLLRVIQKETSIMESIE